ncbi:hypothetical protein B0T18DRAFT_409888 [Schizothecium vesticola]|uniref:Uncharacterized protein n=1 Tax=Schizothecium vesticola TaxID=314040 RepID=A0AA40EUI8_9PEZI|nr:hypothetical protein B0T18DRAFT_409888 [Schizothecium vesticola]
MLRMGLMTILGSPGTAIGLTGWWILTQSSGSAAYLHDGAQILLMAGLGSSPGTAERLHTPPSRMPKWELEPLGLGGSAKLRRRV